MSDDAFMEHLLRTARARSADELLGILRELRGLPNVHTIAADRHGKALYADIGRAPDVDRALIARCRVETERPLPSWWPEAYVGVLDGSDPSCEWGGRPDAPDGGLMPAERQPWLVRDDYVGNSNDNHWLSNPEAPLEGFSPVFGPERTPRSMRTRAGLAFVREVLERDEPMTPARLREILFSHRNYAAELLLDDVLAACDAGPATVALGDAEEDGEAVEADAREACRVLAGWDRAHTVESRGAHLWTEFFAEAWRSGVLRRWAVPFDPERPVDTPRGIRTDDPEARAALLRSMAATVRRLRDAEIPLDAALGEIQYVERAGERIPIPGGHGGAGAYSNIITQFTPGEGYTHIAHGNSYIQVVTWNDEGHPEVSALLTYSQSPEPESPHHADQTRLYARGEWIRLPFTEEEILADPKLRVVEVSGTGGGVARAIGPAADGIDSPHGATDANDVPDGAADPSSLPTLAQLDTGWIAFEPGGETTCALGGEYRFFARRGDPERLFVYLYGGGACSSGEECDPERGPFAPDEPGLGYVHEIVPGADPATWAGVFDLSHPDNPFAGWSMVAVPYCTGDVLLGDRVVTYTIESPEGGRRELTIHHRGQTNTMAAMRWIRANFDAPDRIFVAGVSAGGVAVPFYAHWLARRYERADVVGFGSGIGPVARGEAAAMAFEPWGVPAVLRHHPGWESFDPADGAVGLYVTAGLGAPNLRLYQHDAAYDANMRMRRRVQGLEETDMYALLGANRRAIAERVPRFRAFTLGGDWHGGIEHAAFYALRAGEWRLRDWVAAIAAGDTVPDVACVDCTLATLDHTEESLRIVDRAIEIISEPGAWDPDDAEPCARRADPDRYSLRCAIFQAVLDVTGRPPTWKEPSLATWEAIFLVSHRLGGFVQRAGPGPLQLYNDAEGRTVADVLDLLEAARERIRASMRARIETSAASH